MDDDVEPAKVITNPTNHFQKHYHSSDEEPSPKTTTKIKTHHNPVPAWLPTPALPQAVVEIGRSSNTVTVHNSDTEDEGRGISLGSSRSQNGRERRSENDNRGSNDSVSKSNANQSESSDDNEEDE